MKVSIPVPGALPQMPPCSDPHADPCRFPRVSSPVSFLNMRSYISLVTLLFMLVTSGSLAQESSQSCVCDFDANTDYFPVKVASDYATNFEIEYKKSYKKITITGDSGTVVTYAYLCGTPRPTEVAEGDVVVQIPIDSAALLSTTFLPFINYIGKRTSLHYVAATADDMPSCLRKMYNEGRLSDGFDIASQASKIIETSVSRTGQFPDVVFTDDYNYATTKTQVPQLFGTHTQTILISEITESHPLGPVEWLEVVAALYNAETDAHYIVSSIQQRYNCIKNLIQANPPAQKKKVMWGAFYSYGDGAYLFSPCPGSFFCQIVADAGGEILNGLEADEASVIAMAEQADVWIYPDGNFMNSTVYNSPFLAGEREGKFNDTKVVRNKQVFDYLGDHPLNWFEDRFAEPDVLLMDVVQALWGNTYISDTRIKSFLRNVYTEPAMDQGPRDPSLCTNEDSKLYTEWLTGPCFSQAPENEVAGPPLCKTGSNAADVLRASWMVVASSVVLVFWGM